MSNISTNRELFSATILKQVKIKITRDELESLLEVLRYSVLACNIGVLEAKIIAFNTYKLIGKLQPKLFAMQKSTHTITLNISECYSITQAYRLYPSRVSSIVKIYMEIDSRIH